MKKERSLIVAAFLLIGLSFVPTERLLATSNTVTDSLPGLLQMALILVALLLPLGFPVGTGLLVLIALPRVNKWTEFRAPVITPLVVPSLSIAWLAAQALPFLQLPKGTPIRPMFWALCTVVSALCLMIISTARTVAGWRTAKSTLVCCVALAASLFIIVVPSLSLYAAAALKGLEISP
jgi:hypothetical protein